VGSLRTPFFAIAFVLLVLVVLVEIGSRLFLNQELAKPGLGISYLSLMDGLLLFTLTMIALSLVIPERIHGRLQGIVTLVFSLLFLFGTILMLFIAIGLLILMVTLLLAVPFGTIAYFAAYADFDTGAAQGTLGVIMALKLAFILFMLLAHHRFLQNKSLVLIVLTSLVASSIIGILHGFVPGFLVSITDALGAILVAVLAAIWALLYLLGSVPAIIKVLRVDRSLP